MPLNEDPAAVSDDDYAELIRQAEERADAAGNPVCASAVPADVLAASLARLDAAHE